MKASGELLDTVEAYFESLQWNFERMAGAPVLRTGYAGQHGKYGCLAIADERSGLFTFQAFAPENVPEEARGKVAELIARLNWGYSVGSFGMDYGDGEVRFRTSVDVSGDRLSPALVENVVRANLMVMDATWPMLHAVMTSDLTPEAACEMLRPATATVH